MDSQGPGVHTPLIVSFSGLDGAGKTTQIESARKAAVQLGITTTLVTFWDDVVVGARWRSSFVHKVYGSEPGIGAPGSPVERRDKNVRAWYLTLARHLLYAADAINLRLVLARVRQRGAQVIIVDRYLYDELANLPLDNRFSAAFARLAARVAPRPNLAFLLDADPELARARKPEYPVDFLRQSRRSYFQMAHLLGNLTIVPPCELEEARREVLSTFVQVCGAFRRRPAASGADAAA